MTDFNLKYYLNSLALLRPLALPANINDIVLIVLKNDLQRLNRFLKNYPNINLKQLIIPDLPLENANNLTITLTKDKGKEETLTPLPFVLLQNFPYLEKVFLCPEDSDSIAAYLTEICRYLADSGITTIYLSGVTPPAHSIRDANPNFFEEKRTVLEKALELFSDQESKVTFCRRIKAIITGNAGYLPIASNIEYFFEQVKPAPGDFMIDGGVSDLVHIQELFAKAVGLKGHIFGFEPIPRLAHIAEKKLAKFKNYHLVYEGLAEKKAEAIFADLRDSSHISSHPQLNPLNELPSGFVKCQLNSIDNFCMENHIKRVDCIKLDVEGGELMALTGAAKTIVTNKPKLIICMYHKPQDLYEIPTLIKKLVPEYQVFLRHSSCQFMDTILYARIPD